MGKSGNLDFTGTPLVFYCGFAHVSVLMNRRPLPYAYDPVQAPSPPSPFEMEGSPSLHGPGTCPLALSSLLAAVWVLLVTVFAILGLVAFVRVQTQNGVPTSSNYVDTTEGVPIVWPSSVPSQFMDPESLPCLWYMPGSPIQQPMQFIMDGFAMVVHLYMRDNPHTPNPRYCFIVQGKQSPYQPLLQSPTLRVKPGSNVYMRFDNWMQGESPGSQPAAFINTNLCSGGTPGHLYSMLQPNQAANLHLHGSIGSPQCHHDDVVNTFIGDHEEFYIKLDIPDNQPPGLYWYHPHLYGIVEPQIQGGASGLLIVDGIEALRPEVIGSRELLLVIRDTQPLPTASDTDPGFDLSVNYVPLYGFNYSVPTLMLQTSTLYFFRILNSAADTMLDLQFLNSTRTPHPFQLVGVDAVPVTGSLVEVTHWLLATGGRVEFLLRTPASGSLHLVTNAVDTGPKGDYDPFRPLADITFVPSQTSIDVHQQGLSTPLFSQTWDLVPTPYQPTLVLKTVDTYRTLYFSEVPVDPADPEGPTHFFVTVVGDVPSLPTLTADAAPKITVYADSVEEWTIQNTSNETHVFHIHQSHFLVTEENGQTISNPLFYDTRKVDYWDGTVDALNQPLWPSIKIKIWFTPGVQIEGEFVYHCHISRHEDEGMLQTIAVIRRTL